ncbi:Transmembrane Epididymal Protein 1 [Manis pentadactyla]|nr:Transmembrane Epididymal Protein 1 [Manis pentadactyla]
MVTALRKRFLQQRESVAPASCQGLEPQMESVGVYGFCGCTAKNKMKCDSRWEIAATGIIGNPLLYHQQTA